MLVADGRSAIRWWDAGSASGPADVGDLPVSPELAADLDRLGAAYDELAEADLEDFGVVWERDALGERARTLWRRAAAEIGSRFVVGYVGPDMRRPAWVPSDLSDGDVDGAFEDLFLD